MSHHFSTLILLFMVTGWLPNVQAEFVARPSLPLAKVYRPGIALPEYWVSEKLDGVRAYWDGKQLISKQGNRFRAPMWFTNGFPSYPLDGELWIGRNRFTETIRIIKRKVQDDTHWKKIRYMVFDLPAPDLTFDQRLNRLNHLFADLQHPYLKLVKQYHLPNHQALMENLEDAVQQGAEGLMLHLGRALYRSGRHSDILKVKPYYDDDAVVIGHIPGKGKYTGMLGALLVKMRNGKQFRVGTGFTDQQRHHPPPIGALITYQYHGFTQNGIPKFASFLRIRTDQ